MSLFDRLKSQNANVSVHPMEDDHPTVALSVADAPEHVRLSIPNSPVYSPTSFSNVSGVIGASMTIRGDIEFEGELRIQGQVVGNIRCIEDSKSMLIVDEKAEVHGEINVPVVKIAGLVKGPVFSTEHLHVMMTGHVDGPANYNLIQLDSGAIVAGGMSPEFRSRVKS